jgi:hypothetical protein
MRAAHPVASSIAAAAPPLSISLHAPAPARAAWFVEDEDAVAANVAAHARVCISLCALVLPLVRVCFLHMAWANNVCEKDRRRRKRGAQAM